MNSDFENLRNIFKEIIELHTELSDIMDDALCFCKKSGGVYDCALRFEELSKKLEVKYSITLMVLKKWR